MNMLPLPLDLALAASLQPWSGRTPARLGTEVAEMAEYFPHWRLVLARPGMRSLADCKACRGMIAPAGGAWRCLECGRPARTEARSGLAWAGHLPALWPEHPRLAGLGQPPAGHVVANAAGRRYLLVPLSAYYPDEWPRHEPHVRYAPQWLSFLQIAGRGAIHMYDEERPCLFYANQWNGVSIRAVLQQRVVNHLHSLVKIAMGQVPHKAFIGKIHDQPWHSG
jgi:hypothetical protein